MPGFTRIEDLPDLDNQGLNAVGAGGDDEYRHRDVNKFIRNNNRMIPNGAGMSREPPPPRMTPPVEMIEQAPVMDMRYHHKQHAPERPDPMSLNCVDVAMHIEQCPICSKFYNGDKSLYVIVIVILAIICLLLLKKVLNL